MVKKHSKRRNNKSKRKYSKKRVSYKSNKRSKKYSKKKQKGGAEDKEEATRIIKNLTDHTNSFDYIEPEEGDSITGKVMENRGAINHMVLAHSNHHERINKLEDKYLHLENQYKKFMPLLTEIWNTLKKLQEDASKPTSPGS